ncbi:MAG: carbohydrate kinase, partial [Planctomycetes bacterium]|nr:carbohydrate kinase [Planctomycetota bacterium]
MNESELRALLNKIKECRIGVVGDFCLDAYLFIDQAGSESSVETGLPTFPVRKSRFFPGGAGNVAANLSALGVKTVLAFGVRGSDIFGEELERLLKEQDIETQGLKIQKEDWHTHVYTKLYEGDKELNRIDFGNFNALHEDTIALVLKCLEKALPELDLIIINQQ